MQMTLALMPITPSLPCTIKYDNTTTSAYLPSLSHHITSTNYSMHLAVLTNTIKWMKICWIAEMMWTTQYHQDNNTPEPMLLACIKHNSATEPLPASTLNPTIPSPIIAILPLTLELMLIMHCSQHHETHSMPSTAHHTMTTAPSIKEWLATLHELIDCLVDVLPIINPSHPKNP